WRESDGSHILAGRPNGLAGFAARRAEQMDVAVIATRREPLSVGRKRQRVHLETDVDPIPLGPRLTICEIKDHEPRVALNESQLLPVGRKSWTARVGGGELMRFAAGLNVTDAQHLGHIRSDDVAPVW